MINKVISTIEKYNMFSSAKTVVAAVSGGSDSMAMLFILENLQKQYGFNLIAAHVNHGIRGDRADSDEMFVRDYCNNNRIEFDVLKANVIDEASRLGMGLEETGRKIRYEYFSSFGKDVIVATAHNATDRVETFLFNFTRGSALRGLGSIPPVRDNFVRPLIECSKAEIEAFCKISNIPFVTDATNNDVVYSRNRIRHNVLPQLRCINSALEVSAMRCIESLCEDETYLSDLANEIVNNSKVTNGYDAAVVNNSPLPIKKRAIIKIIESDLGVTPDRKSVDEICYILAHGGSRQINGGFKVRVRNGVFEFPDECGRSLEKILFSEGSIKFGNAEVVSVLCTAEEINCSQNVSNEALIYYLDYDKIQGEISIRSRESGDKISLKSRGCTKTLKKIFNELAVIPEIRNTLVILSDAAGVLLVEGVGVDSRVEPDKSTKNILAVNILRQKFGKE